MLLELLEDGVMIVFVVAMIDGVVREYPFTVASITGLGMALGLLLSV